MPGPEIGSIRTRSGPSFTAPDFRHAISASARQGSRSAEKNPRPHPTSETRTKEPTRYKQTPRVITRELRRFCLNVHQRDDAPIVNHDGCGPRKPHGAHGLTCCRRDRVENDPKPCENATAINRDGTSYSFKTFHVPPQRIQFRNRNQEYHPRRVSNLGFHTARTHCRT